MPHLTRHGTPRESRWVLDGLFLQREFDLGRLLARPVAEMQDLLRQMATAQPAADDR